jgi:hypothetical protein
VAALVPIIITEAWVEPDGTDTPTGRVAFQLTDEIVSPSYLTAKAVVAELSGGAIAQQVTATDRDATGVALVPATVQYRVVESIDGAPDVVYFITVPAAPSGSRKVADAVATLGSINVTSATAAFTQADVNAYVVLPGFPPGTQIQVVHSATSADLSAAAAAAGSGLSLLIGASVTLSAIRP